jgi:perosamine synthetase
MTKLAIQGGSPVRPTMLPYARQSVDDADVRAVVETLRSDWLTTGPKVAEFEDAFAKTTGARFAVSVSSGTAALHAAAFAAGIAPGDDVVTTPMTFVSTANCVRFQGGTVIFADVDAYTLNLDPLKVRTALTSRARAVVTVDYAGQPSSLDELMLLAEQNNLVVIEDASHALGARYHGRRVGALAHLTTFSLHPVKHITTGEGGMITTDDLRMADRLRAFRSHGISTDYRAREAKGSWFYEMLDLGYNYRLTDIQSALGLSQLNKLPEWLVRRCDIASQYTMALAELPEVATPVVLPDRESAWHLYVIRLNLERLRTGRADVFRALRAENIGVNVHYIPVPWHPYYQQLGYKKGEWPVTEDAYERMISLPIFPGMSDQDVNDVIAAVRKVIAHFRR